MQRHAYLSLSIGLFVGGAVLISKKLSSGNRASSVDTSPSRTALSEIRARAATVYGHLPLHFEANQGQTDPRVTFLARGSGHTLFLTETEAVLVLTQAGRAAKGELEQRVGATQLALRMRLVGANPRARVTGLNELPGKANYFVGRDPAQWHCNVPLYATVHYRDVYPGIDLSYSGDQRQLLSAFVVRPGGDANRIVLDWQGADSVVVDAEGDLVLHTAVGLVRQAKPAVYQELDAARRDIAGRYVRKGVRQLGFEVTAYDASRPLVIEGNTLFSIRATR